MNFLKATGHSVRFVQRRGLVKTARFYSTVPPKHQSSSNIPWALGSFLVFGPILFKLTSPPPPTKKAESHYPDHVKPHQAIQQQEPVQPVEKEEAVVEAPVKKVQKPYVLVGAGTASFAAAQAIKEKDPEANVILS